MFGGTLNLAQLNCDKYLLLIFTHDQPASFSLGVAFTYSCLTDDMTTIQHLIAVDGTRRTVDHTAHCMSRS